MDFVPRMKTFEAPPMPADEALMFTPATLPLSELMKLTSLLAMPKKYVDKYKDRYNYLDAARKLLQKNQENKK